MLSKLDSEDKPSLFSERRLRPPRRSLSDLNVPSARPEDLFVSRDARLSSLSMLTKERPRRTVPSIN